MTLSEIWSVKHFRVVRQKHLSAYKVPSVSSEVAWSQSSGVVLLSGLYSSFMKLCSPPNYSWDLQRPGESETTHMLKMFSFGELREGPKNKTVSLRWMGIWVFSWTMCYYVEMDQWHDTFLSLFTFFCYTHCHSEVWIFFFFLGKRNHFIQERSIQYIKSLQRTFISYTFWGESIIDSTKLFSSMTDFNIDDNNTIFIEQQIKLSLLEWFLKDRVTLKTGVMMLKIQLCINTFT